LKQQEKRKTKNRLAEDEKLDLKEQGRACIAGENENRGASNWFLEKKGGRRQPRQAWKREGGTDWRRKQKRKRR